MKNKTILILADYSDAVRIKVCDQRETKEEAEVIKDKTLIHKGDRINIICPSDYITIKVSDRKNREPIVEKGIRCQFCNTFSVQ